MPTKQEIFDKSVFGLRGQGGPSFVIDDRGDINCRYRAPNGRKCAVGHVISDADYDGQFEGRVAAGLPTQLVKYLGGPHLIGDLQAAHDEEVVRVRYQCKKASKPFDDSKWLRFFEARAQVVAECHGLVYTPPETAA